MEVFIFIIIAMALYFFPSIVAMMKGSSHKDAILLTNLLLGWTGLGWVIALIWSVIPTNKG